MGENSHFKSGHARVETRVFKNATVSRKCRRLLQALIESLSVRLKNARVEKMPLNICIRWNAGTACLSESRAKDASASGFACRPF